MLELNLLVREPLPERQNHVEIVEHEGLLIEFVLMNNKGEPALFQGNLSSEEGGVTEVTILVQIHKELSHGRSHFDKLRRVLHLRPNA